MTAAACAPLDAAAVRAEPVVDIGGVPMRLSASDDARADAVAALFRHAAPTTAEPRCAVRFSKRVLTLPSAAPMTVLDGLQLWRPVDEELVLRSARGLTARATAERIDIAGDAPALGREFRYLATFALTHTLAHHERHVLHGAAIACDELALLVLGGSGAGKSTLVLGALRSGWRAVADDLVAARRFDGSLYATGLPRPISVPPDVAVDDLAGGAVPHDARNRIELRGGTLTNSTHPIAGVIVVARGAAAATRVDTVAPHDVLHAVLGASVSLADHTLRPDVFALAAALARLPAWSLHHGADAATRLRSAGVGLADVRARLAAATPT